jgi:hypothetical protein
MCSLNKTDYSVLNSKIHHCVIEYHSTIQKERNESIFQVVLTNNFFYFSNDINKCFGCVTSTGSFIIILIDDPEIYDNPPEGSYAQLLLKSPRSSSFSMMDFSSAPYIDLSNRFLVQLKHLSVTGPANVYIECCHESLVSMVFKNGAQSCMYLSSAKTQLRISQKSSLKLLGSVTDVVVDKLDVDSSLDLCECKLDTTVECSFTIPTADPIGNIFIHPNMSYIRETIVDAILRQRVAKSPKETERQRYVRCQLKIPLAKENIIEVSEDHEKVCRTCFAFVANAKFDCGHVYMCVTCAEKMRSMPYSEFPCPVCRDFTKSITIDETKEVKEVKKIVKIRKSKRQRIN